jgi:hypothetical protein
MNACLYGRLACAPSNSCDVYTAQSSLYQLFRMCLKMSVSARVCVSVCARVCLPCLRVGVSACLCVSVSGRVSIPCLRVGVCACQCTVSACLCLRVSVRRCQSVSETLCVGVCACLCVSGFPISSSEPTQLISRILAGKICNSYAVLLNFLQSILSTWRTCEFTGAES